MKRALMQSLLLAAGVLAAAAPALGLAPPTVRGLARRLPAGAARAGAGRST